MPYCTKQNMIDRFGEEELIQFTDRENLGIIDDTVLNQAIDDASAEIDSYLQKFDLPLSTIPARLEEDCCHIARYKLDVNGIIEKAKENYDAVIKFLNNVAKGSISLGTDESGNAPTTSSIAVMNSGGRVFSRDDNSFL